jgi:hypothetical protein
VRALLLVAALALGCTLQTEPEEPMRGYREGAAARVLNDVNWGFASMPESGALPAEGTVVPLVKTPAGEPPVTHGVLLSTTPNLGSTNADVRAQVTFGTGAMTTNFLCDFANGAQFSLVAQQVQIDAVTFRPSLLTAYNPTPIPGGGRLGFGAGLVRGELTPPFPLTYTEPVVSLATITQRIYKIPAFARRARIYSSTTILPATINVQLATSDLSTLFWSTDGTPFQATAAVALPGYADVLVLLNADASTRTFIVQWELSI